MRERVREIGRESVCVCVRGIEREGNISRKNVRKTRLEDVRVKQYHTISKSVTCKNRPKVV